ncbi:hypothetical protein OG453_00780 [Streptomyces sp. NBC_01381]|uniref:hypothetical protein n=1 Tax=Streptomyces sp. NBC_01381 TaxID=2903845 RepID=UPI0022598396|nr:hypothetical protein [Streptomyces sp. NBC_01381]MCX4665220.1 hypothetical protein [Streptomyces sp. NBC_01381]
MLFVFMLAMGVGLTAAAVNSAIGGLARVGLGAGAVSAFVVAWWCARYWYAAFSPGRRAEPAPEPNPWPWVLPWAVLVVALLVTGVRQLGRGEDEGWFTLGFGGSLVMPAIVGGLMGLWVSARLPRGSARRARRARRTRRAAPAAPRLGLHRLTCPTAGGTLPTVRRSSSSHR